MRGEENDANMEEHQDKGEDDPSLGGLTSGLSGTRASRNKCRGLFSSVDWMFV